MAAKKVPGKSAGASKAVKPKATSVAPGVRYALDTRLALNRKRKHGNANPQDVRSYLAITAPAGQVFNSTNINQNKIHQSPGRSRKWGFKAQAVSVSGELIVSAKRVGARLKGKTGFIDDLLDIDVTVTNEPVGGLPPVTWVGTATIEYVEINLPPT